MTQARALIDRLLAADPGQRTAVLALGGSCLDESRRRRSRCIEAGRRRGRRARSEFDERPRALQDFVDRVPGQIPALLKLVEVCVDGGLESAMYEAQEQLTDAYLAAARRPKPA